MPLNTGIALLKGYVRERARRLDALERPRWALTDQAGIPDAVKAFDSKPENERWKAMTNDKAADLNQLIGVRAQIAWLGSCRLSLRRQFASGVKDELRGNIHRQRYQYFHQELSRRALELFEYLQTQERSQKITG